jgi:hypothetical protein
MLSDDSVRRLAIAVLQHAVADLQSAIPEVPPQCCGIHGAASGLRSILVRARLDSTVMRCVNGSASSFRITKRPRRSPSLFDN